MPGGEARARQFAAQSERLLRPARRLTQASAREGERGRALGVAAVAEAAAGHSFLAQERQPIRGVVIGAAIRQVLSDNPGIFEPIAHHGATERELVRVYRELRDLEEGDLNLLASTGERGSEVVRVCGAANPKAKCMKDGKCEKHFPKEFQRATTWRADAQDTTSQPLPLAPA